MRSRTYLCSSWLDRNPALDSEIIRITEDSKVALNRSSLDARSHLEGVNGPGCTEAAVAVQHGPVHTVLHVLDRGMGFAHTSRLPPDLFSETGRGLFLITAITEEFTVAIRSDGGSHAGAVLGERFPRLLLREEVVVREDASAFHRNPV